MRVLIAAGGSGGHIYPGIAVASEIMQRDSANAVRFVGAESGLEKTIVPENGFEISLFESSGLKNMGLLGKIKGLILLPMGFVAVRRILNEFKPDVVVGVGGYVSGAVMLTASISRIPTLVMDSNALPGFTNRVLARFVTKAALGFEEALKYFGDKGVVTGNAIRKEFFEIAPRTPDVKFNILVFGGSQGARAINFAMVDALKILGQYKGNLRITHQTGRYDYDDIKKGYADNDWEDADIRIYIEKMDAQFTETDLIVSRAGAATCGEIAAAGKASIMIPLPTAADDHQRVNAEALENAGAAKMILQADLTGESLAREIINFIESPTKIAATGNAARAFAKSNATEATVDIIESLARGREFSEVVAARNEA